ncbi:MAG: hypothetical protein R3345_06485 [Fulvivirga sp.]|nr:hypothetical protein [Fulvivirga sp.]
MVRYIYLLVVLFGMGMVGCAPSVTPSATEDYSEDLSSMRPTIEQITFDIDTLTDIEDEPVDETSYVEPTHDVTGSLNAVIDSIAKLRQDIRYLDGYTILVYSGTSSEQAQIAKGKVHSIIDDSNPSLRFEEPNFRVKVGEYFSRLEAQEDYALLRKEFPKSIIIPARISIE